MGKFQLRSKGGPTMANTKSHGTNANFKKSGMNNADGSAIPGEGAPFLGKAFKGLGKMAGNFIKGKGPMGFMNPIGMLANKAGMFNKKNNQNTTATTSEGDTGVPTTPVADTNAPIGSEGTVVPNQEELQTN